MHSKLSSQEYRLDVASIRDNRGCIRLSLNLKIHALESPWAFGIVDYATGRGFHYQMTTSVGQISMSDGNHTFLELNQSAMPTHLRLALEIQWFGKNFLPAFEIQGISPLISLPAVTLPTTTHLSAKITLPANVPVVRLEDWQLDTVSTPSQELEVPLRNSSRMG